MSSPSSAVVVCAYTLNRWDDLCLALDSVRDQSVSPDETWLVIDHNDALLARSRERWEADGVRVLANERKQGLSGARNTALEHVGAEIVAFLDDDAAADVDWLARLLAPYARPEVIAVGGAAAPRWSAGDVRPNTLPAPRPEARGELDWVVGCTYQGQPTTLAPVRNLMGCNMSFRVDVYAAVGGFAEHLGRVGKVPLGCEETEYCIRAHLALPSAEILFEPRALISHHVSSDRLTWAYLLRRCYAEGISKAAVASMVGQQQALETESRYARQVLPRGLARELRGTVVPRAGSRRRHVASTLR